MNKTNDNLVLTGFMGTGKSLTGKLLSKKLRWQFIDTDKVLEKRFQKYIPDIFRELGEAAFRKAEADLCQELSQQKKLVIATGGGTLVPFSNFNILQKSGTVFCLNARLKTIQKRIAHKQNRPLFSFESLPILLADRSGAYNRIFHQVTTDDFSPEQVADHILERYQLDNVFSKSSIFVQTPPKGLYPIWIQNNGLEQFGSFLKWIGLSSKRIVIVTNKIVSKFHAAILIQALEAAQYKSITIEIPDGESHKNLDTVQRLYQQLLQHQVNRKDTLLALGGGVTGDITGFVAATFLRGINFLQAPTTLLAMVDSSVGGKTGVDMKEGKNLVGAFKQPAAVLIDPSVLDTLPEAEHRSGLAEVIKHAIINNAGLFLTLENIALPLNNLEIILKQAIQVKVGIVQKDPFEHDRRAVLNLGHTFAHAIELASRYQIRHGEAVALGLIASASLAHDLQLCDANLAKRISRLLTKFQLPTSLAGFSPDTIYEAMLHDKKKQNQTLRFILPRAIGAVDIFEVESKDVILKAIRLILSKTL
jgi:shikimate kinase / 3-dehydroquinate synthase